MTETKTTVRFPGSGLAMTLFIVFLILKLVGVIHWSWWWVTSPLWISAGLWVLIVVIVLTIAALIAAFKK